MTATLTNGATQDARLVPLRTKVVLAAIAIGVFGFICYGIGTQRGSTSHELTGRAYVGGGGVASVVVDGWGYGFPVSPGGMSWYDSDGIRHDNGIPPCLQQPGRTAMIRFGWVTAPGLHGQDSTRAVTWVQCVSSS